MAEQYGSQDVQGSAIPVGESPANPTLTGLFDKTDWEVHMPEKQRWAGDARPRPSKSAGGERVR